MEGNPILRLIYTFFLGLLLAIFVGIGTNTFYPGPPVPEYPVELNTYGKEPTPEQAARQRQFDRQMAEHQRQMKPYNRNVSIITLITAIILLIISLVFEERVDKSEYWITFHAAPLPQ